MRRALSALFLVLVLPAAWSQVLANHPFETEIAHARAIEAGTTATDLPHHVHYDLKLYNHKGKLTTGTWDIWRDPQHYIRTDIVAGDFRYTRIEDRIRKIEWRHFNTVMPLKVHDLLQNYSEPEFAVTQFAAGAPDNVRFQQVDGSPFDCTSQVYALRICFDPLVHVLAFAQMYNQNVTWEDWQPLGAHSIPRRFRIYDAGRIMVEAAGRAEPVKTFPPGLLVIPPDQPDMGEPENNGSAPHKVLSTEPVSLAWLYGNVLVHVFVDADGKVTKVDLIDADDDDLIHDAETFAHHIRFAPQAPFDEYIYLRYAPNAH